VDSEQVKSLAGLITACTGFLGGMLALIRYLLDRRRNKLAAAREDLPDPVVEKLKNASDEERQMFQDLLDSAVISVTKLQSKMIEDLHTHNIWQAKQIEGFMARLPALEQEIARCHESEHDQRNWRRRVEEEAAKRGWDLAST
jgi:hypothetical protein